MTPALRTQRSVHSERAGQSLFCADQTTARAARSPPSLEQPLASRSFRASSFLVLLQPLPQAVPERAHSAACPLPAPEFSVQLRQPYLSLLPVRTCGKTSVPRARTAGADN